MPSYLEYSNEGIDLKRLLFTKKEAAHMLCLSERTVSNLIDLGELRAVRIGSSVRISMQVLEAFILHDSNTSDQVRENLAEALELAG